MTGGPVFILLYAIFGISWVAVWSKPQQVYQDMPGNNQQPNNMQHEAFDRQISYVPDNFFRNVDQSIVFHKDSKVFSSVPLKEVSSSDGHSKLAGTVKIPGGVSSVTIERSPQGQKTSQVIEYGHIKQDRPVVISTNQEISDIPEEVPNQQGIKAPTGRLPANDRNTEHVKPNNDRPENHGVNHNKDSKIDQSIVFHKDSKIYSSVPLKEVSSSEGHRKLFGTSKIPGGISSVAIEESPRHRHVSQVIKYGPIKQDGPVVISTNQEISDIPEEVPNQQGIKAPTGRLPANDRNTEHVKPNNDRPESHGVNHNKDSKIDQSIVFHKDSKIYSSVPLKEVSSNEGHRKLVGTSKIPGGISSVAIEESPRHRHVSQVIKYGPIEQDGLVVISTNQEISDIPEEVPNQQGIKAPTGRLPANDRNTEHVKPNNDRPENHGVNHNKDSKIDQSIVFHKDSKINSSVPLKEVSSSEGHRKLVGTSKIPGGISSVAIEESPRHRHVSQVIKYGPIKQDGPVVISTNQEISDIPEEVPNQQGIKGPTGRLPANDRNTEHVKPNNDRPENHGVNHNKDSKIDQSIVFHKDSKIYSSVPLKEVSSSEGHRKLVGTSKIPGGISSVAIEESPRHRHVSQVIKYGPIKQDGPVVISTNQEISDIPEEGPNQQGIKAPTGRLPANDRNTEHVKPNNDRPENHGVNHNKDSKIDQSIVFHKDSKIYSSVPLKEVSSSEGHRKLVGTFKIPGGISSVAIEESPRHRHVSQVIKYGPIKQDGPVVISTNQEISDIPEEVPNQQGIKGPTGTLPANDRNTEHVKPNNDRPENHGVNHNKDSKIDQTIVFHKDSKIYSSVPLEEVSSSEGHRKLVRTSKIPGGISSMAIEESPRHRHVSQVIKYGPIKQDGPVVISTNQEISDIPEEVPNQQVIKAQTGKLPANDRNTEHVKPNNDRPENHGVNHNKDSKIDQSIVFNKDSKIYSSVPLKEVSSSEGHRKLVGTSKLPGGISSVAIEESPRHRHVSQVIKYGPIKQDGPVVISTNQEISDIPEEGPNQQGIKAPTGRLPANDRNTEHVKPNNDRPENHGVNHNKDSKIDQSIVFHKDSKIYSSVPLKEVRSSEGHRKLVGTSKIPGGISSVAIEESPRHRHVSQVIKYGPIKQDGPVVISTNQEISDIPEEVPNQQGIKAPTGRLPANDRNTEHVKPNNDRPENHGVNHNKDSKIDQSIVFHKDSKIYSSVPLKEVSSSEGHRKLVGTSKIPGGISSMAIEESPRHRHVSQFIKYGPVIINSN